MKTHIIRRREGETLSDYVMRWLETDRERSKELRVSLDALEELCAGCRKPPQGCSCAEAADLDRRRMDDMQRACGVYDYPNPDVEGT